jgi:hypothetical protein
LELRDLAKKVDQTAFMQKLLPFWKIKRWLFGGWPWGLFYLRVKRGF